MNMLRGWSRWAPLTGLVSAVLGVAGGAIEVITNPPGADASGKEVIAFYSAQGGTQQLAGALLALAFVFFLFFAGSLRSYLRKTPDLEALSTIAVAGAAVETAGQTTGAGYVWTLAQGAGHLESSAAQALNALSNNAVATNTAGMIVFGIAAGLAILRSRRLPSWLGWLAIAMAVLVVTPVEAVSFLALVVWMVVLSILIWRRGGQGRQEQGGDTP
jgi:uncharacterized membrane protein YhaH (DUF805 family)